MIRVVRIGERARQALARSRGEAIALAGFAGGPYFAAAGELIWVGARLPAMHPRAVITEDSPVGDTVLHFVHLPAQGWMPRPSRPGRSTAARIAANAGTLCRAVLAADAPRGFGALLAGAMPAFPLDLAVARVQALARAYRQADAHAVLSASIALLGIGAGLTPSGDDLAGAALFGRRLLAPRTRAWEDVAEQLAREAGQRSHAISAALLGDLVRGESFAPLHAIAEALAADDHAAALAAARNLTPIGHSSGWDMFTGLVIGITGSLGDGAKLAAQRGRERHEQHGRRRRRKAPAIAQAKELRGGRYSGERRARLAHRRGQRRRLTRAP